MRWASDENDPRPPPSGGFCQRKAGFARRAVRDMPYRINRLLRRPSGDDDNFTRQCRGLLQALGDGIDHPGDGEDLEQPGQGPGQIVVDQLIELLIRVLGDLGEYR